MRCAAGRVAAGWRYAFRITHLDVVAQAGGALPPEQRRNCPVCCGQVRLVRCRDCRQQRITHRRCSVTHLIWSASGIFSKRFGIYGYPAVLFASMLP